MCRFYVLFCATALAVAACDTATVGQRAWVARVDGTVITVDAFQQRYAQTAKEVGELPVLSPAAIGELKRRTLMEMIDEALLLAAAEKNGIVVDEQALGAAIAEMRRDISEREWRRFLLEHYVDDEVWRESVRRRVMIDRLIDAHLGAAVAVSEAAARAYYDANREQFARPPQVYLAQIVVDDEALANRLLQQLAEGADFAELAREYSLGPEAAIGGNMGLLAAGDLPDSFAAAFSLGAGDYSRVVPTEYGYHIFFARSVEPAQTLAFEQARDRIEQVLLAERRHTVRQELIMQLRTRASIEVERSVWQRISQP